MEAATVEAPGEDAATTMPPPAATDSAQEVDDEEPIVIRETQGQMDCTSNLRTFDERVHKKKYKVAVHAIRGAWTSVWVWVGKLEHMYLILSICCFTKGFEAAFQEYNLTFAQYLTQTAGRRFDPPIEFEMQPVDFQGLFDAVENEEVGACRELFERRRKTCISLIVSLFVCNHL